MRRLLLPLTIIAVLFTANTAHAAYIDLTAADSTGSINGALFEQGETLSGTGVFPAFVQVAGAQNVNTSEAYNTTVNNVLNNGSSDTFNHEITVSQLTTEGAYYVFLLDINESNAANSGDAYLSLDELIILTSTTANQSSEPLPTGTVRYDMDLGDATNGVLLNYDLEAGSGDADVKLLVPIANFAGALSTDFVYLYSSFGALGVLTAGNPYGAPAGNYGTSDGFEEWALSVVTVPPPPPDPSAVPEPGSLLLLGSGLVGAAAAARRRRQAKKQ